MNDRALQISGDASHGHVSMQKMVGEASLLPARQSQRVVGSPAAVFNERAAETGMPGQAVAIELCGRRRARTIPGNCTQYFPLQAIGYNFIGVKRQYPVTLRQSNASLLLRSVPGPVGDVDGSARDGSAGGCLIGAAGVQNQNFIREINRINARGDLMRLISGGDNDA